ncbi:hypothetical protein SODALDRAFT_224495 [Sodiomyces alkalinus F11]|uniref:Uncharacterized protein n=1 Tax=Sodiomyces alkalinus (strain CBS 110278 / VKM F-3762 / F11) TaxID=1314773 RepID=A0A3N2PQ60_SODAK|nr:hypothetical protein SODALDRAFT_224495 [Sodiomyces alkalinus F11]ROT36647.1 hypothetical protein SODALDRAFT_224495 [Sodiomyces alkalinus F11]
MEDIWRMMRRGRRENEKRRGRWRMGASGEEMGRKDKRRRAELIDEEMDRLKKKKLYDVFVRCDLTETIRNKTTDLSRRTRILSMCFAVQAQVVVAVAFVVYRQPLVWPFVDTR